MTDTSISIPLDQLPPGTLKQVKFKGDNICLANVDGHIYAVSDSCTHARIPLSDGCLEGQQVVCPWHGAMFDLKTGRATCGPAVDSLRCYTTRVEQNQIVIDVL